MRVFAKETIAAAAAVTFILAVNTSSMLFAPAHAETSMRVTQSTEDGSNSVRVTQSTEDGLEVDCDGNIRCEIIGDDTVVATSEDNTDMSSAAITGTTTTTTTNLNQSDIIQSENALDVIDDEQDLGSAIMGMVNRLLDRVLA